MTINDVIRELASLKYERDQMVLAIRTLTNTLDPEYEDTWAYEAVAQDNPATNLLLDKARKLDELIRDISNCHVIVPFLEKVVADRSDKNEPLGGVPCR